MWFVRTGGLPAITGHIHSPPVPEISKVRYWLTLSLADADSLV